MIYKLKKTPGLSESLSPSGDILKEPKTTGVSMQQLQEELSKVYPNATI